MKLFDLIKIIDSNTLICIEETYGPECIYCGDCGSLTVGKLQEINDRTVIEIYPESYGAYYGRHGISILISRKKQMESTESQETGMVYKIIAVDDPDGSEKYVIQNTNGQYFASYDFMGSVKWVQDRLAAYHMSFREAVQIKSDLQAEL